MEPRLSICSIAIALTIALTAACGPIDIDIGMVGEVTSESKTECENDGHQCFDRPPVTPGTERCWDGRSPKSQFSCDSPALMCCAYQSACEQIGNTCVLEGLPCDLGWQPTLTPVTESCAIPDGDPRTCCEQTECMLRSNQTHTCTPDIGAGLCEDGSTPLPYACYAPAVPLQCCPARM